MAASAAGVSRRISPYRFRGAQLTGPGMAFFHLATTGLCPSTVPLGTRYPLAPGVAPKNFCSASFTIVSSITVEIGGFLFHSGDDTCSTLRKRA